MPEINEAYRVLSDPGRRAMYDASRRTAPGVPVGEPPVDTPVAPMHPSHLAPARIPWRSSLVVFVVAAIGIIVLAQFTEPGEPPGPDGILRVGDCIEVERENFAREVACTGDVEIDVRVAAFVAFDAPCPGVTERYQDRQGMGVACVERP